jgi:heme oxygenase-like protein
MHECRIENVENTFETTVKKMAQAVDEFPWENEACYVQWLGQTYYMVRHTTRFLTLSAGLMKIAQESFHQFYLHHLREETNHEMMAYRDFENLDWSIEDIPETMEAQLMIQSQYHFLHQTPFAHFGFFWCLERLSCDRGQMITQRARKAHGPESISFITLHAAEDVGHVKTIRDKVSEIPASNFEDLIRNIEQTGYLYSKMLNEIGAKYSQKIKAA